MRVDVNLFCVSHEQIYSYKSSFTKHITIDLVIYGQLQCNKWKMSTEKVINERLIINLFTKKLIMYVYIAVSIQWVSR